MAYLRIVIGLLTLSVGAHTAPKPGDAAILYQISVDGSWDSQTPFLKRYLSGKFPQKNRPRDASLRGLTWNPSLPAWHLTAVAVAIENQSGGIEADVDLINRLLEQMPVGDEETDGYQFAFYTLIYLTELSNGPSRAREMRQASAGNESKTAAVQRVLAWWELLAPDAGPADHCGYLAMEYAIQPQILRVLNARGELN